MPKYERMAQHYWARASKLPSVQWDAQTSDVFGAHYYDYDALFLRAKAHYYSDLAVGNSTDTATPYPL